MVTTSDIYYYFAFKSYGKMSSIKTQGLALLAEGLSLSVLGKDIVPDIKFSITKYGLYCKEISDTHKMNRQSATEKFGDKDERNKMYKYLKVFSYQSRQCLDAVYNKYSKMNLKEFREFIEKSDPYQEALSRSNGSTVNINLNILKKWADKNLAELGKNIDPE